MLVVALGKALDALTWHVEADDDAAAAVAGGVVRTLLAHPHAADLAEDLGWRRQLARWRTLRARVGPVPLDCVDHVEHYVRVRLADATRDVQLGPIEASA